MKNRPERLICFLVVWLTMFSCIWVHGQMPYPDGLKKNFLLLRYPGTPNSQFSRKSIYFDKRELNAQAGVSYAQPADLYYIQSGFFCKREWELEKVTHIPFRFRLGSLADCDALEGKR